MRKENKVERREGNINILQDMEDALLKQMNDIREKETQFIVIGNQLKNNVRNK